MLTLADKEGEGGEANYEIGCQKEECNANTEIGCQKGRGLGGSG